MTATRFAVALTAVAFVLAGCSSSPNVPQASGTAGCGAVMQFAGEGQQHVQSPGHPRYRTDPPTSGPHYPRPAQTGVYAASPPPREALVHNMEHGHVIFWVVPGRLSDGAYQGLVALVKADETRLVLVPQTGIPPSWSVAFTAWQHSQTCSDGDAAVAAEAAAFVARFVGRGPEGDLPGTPHT
ncbi:MAG: DUF3105 domain-containing protein [Actinomycetota bacterium]|nr:DUF3105 domain-containing protein [Actinomycetota bacterium]